jgi:hypothetical protein
VAFASLADDRVAAAAQPADGCEAVLVWLVTSLWIVVVLSGGYLVVWLFRSLLSGRAAPWSRGELYDDMEIDSGHKIGDLSRRRSIDATNKMAEFLDTAPAPTDLATWRESAAARGLQIRQGSGRA